MEITGILRRKARIVADVEERSIPMNINNDLGNPPTVIDMPPLYVVEVQVKTLLGWTTVWRECCDIGNADARNKIGTHAHEVYKVLTE
jgi:hypothetical protein